MPIYNEETYEKWRAFLSDSSTEYSAEKVQLFAREITGRDVPAVQRATQEMQRVWDAMDRGDKHE